MYSKVVYFQFKNERTELLNINIISPTYTNNELYIYIYIYVNCMRMIVCTYTHVYVYAFT